MTALPAPRWYTPAGYVRLPDGLHRLPWYMERRHIVMDRVTVSWPGLSVDITYGAECGCILRAYGRDMSLWRMEYRGEDWDAHRKAYRFYTLSIDGEPCLHRSDPMWTYYNAPHGRGGVGPNYAGD